MSKRTRESERESLTSRGFDGLYHPDPAAQCGCYADDLYPCGERPKECRPGRAASDGSGVYGPVKEHAVSHPKVAP